MHVIARYAGIFFLVCGPGCHPAARETPSAPDPDSRVADPSAEDRSTEATSPFLWPPSPCVFVGHAAQAALLADGQAPAPTLTLNGRSIRPAEWLLAEDWNDTRRSPARPYSSADSEDDNAVLSRPPLRAGQRVLFWTDDLTAGRQLLEADGWRIDLFVRSKIPDEPPSDWPIFKPHPPAKQLDAANPCAACHTMKDGRLGLAPEPQSCWTCHDEPAFEEVHDHPLGPLRRCGMCHEAHGSTAPRGLLKDDRPALCARCH